MYAVLWWWAEPVAVDVQLYTSWKQLSAVRTRPKWQDLEINLEYECAGFLNSEHAVLEAFTTHTHKSLCSPMAELCCVPNERFMYETTFSHEVQGGNQKLFAYDRVLLVLSEVAPSNATWSITEHDLFDMNISVPNCSPEDMTPYFKFVSYLKKGKREI